MIVGKVAHPVVYMLAVNTGVPGLFGIACRHQAFDRDLIPVGVSRMLGHKKPTADLWCPLYDDWCVAALIAEEGVIWWSLSRTRSSTSLCAHGSQNITMNTCVAYTCRIAQNLNMNTDIAIEITSPVKPVSDVEH